MFLGKELKIRESPWENCERVHYLVKLKAADLHIFEKWTPWQIFYKDFTSIITYPSFIIFLKFNNNYFQGTLLGRCFWKLWKLNGALEYRCSWNSKTSYVLEFYEQLFSRKPFTFHSLFFGNPLMPGGNKNSQYLNKPALKAAGLFKYMYMIFCYHQALNGYFYQCWKRIYISWMIIGNYTSYTKSEFYEIVNVINKCIGQPLSVKCDFWNGLNNERCK